MSSPPDLEQMAVALRQISRGLSTLADALSSASRQSEDDRYFAVMTEWGPRGLTREEASRLFRRQGFSPQAVGGWVRGGWLEVRDDDKRYLTERSVQWLAEQGARR
ncbi:MAG: hypothetical protein ACRDNL_14245 [Spirillospora sp.]